MFLFYNDLFPDFKGGRNEIEINHLTKVIQGNVVLDDINACFPVFPAKRGRIYGIQGINGSGKTMLMRVICGLVPTMGTVSIDGEIIGKGISFPRSIGLCWRTIFIDEFTGAKIFLFSVISNDLFRKRRLAIRCVVSD